MAGSLPADRSYNKHTGTSILKFSGEKITMVKVYIYINSED